MNAEFSQQAEKARKDIWSYEEYLLELAQNEVAARDNKRFNRLLKESGLPISKSLANFDLSRLPKGIQHQFNALLDARFLERKENILVFGTPGGGKTHLVCELAQEMIRKGFKAYFRSCARRVNGGGFPFRQLIK